MLSILVSVAAGILLSLAFPKANLHWVAWFALAPLMYYTYSLTWKRALVCGMSFGLGFFASLLYWISPFGLLPWIALAVFQGLFVVAFAAAAKLIGARQGPWSRVVLLPALWVAFEWIRSLGMFGFTWGDIGYSQYRVPAVIQMSSLTGVWGVSFALVLSNAALANLFAAWRGRRELAAVYAQTLLVALAVLAVVVFGFVSARGPSPRTGERLRAVVIQGNISQDTEEDMEYGERTWRTYGRMTAAAAEQGADLIVWPETVVPGIPGRDEYIQGRLAGMVPAGGRLLVGGWDEGGRGEVYNSAFLVGRDTGILGRYWKVRLVPFGEFVPARRYMPFLQYYRVRPYDTSPGPTYNLLDAGAYAIGTSICFESAFPETARRLTASGANLLCVITNDEWFGQSAAAEQHMAKSVFRAVENHRYLVRGAATGISCVIDPRGRILVSSGLFSRAIVEADVRTESRMTFYSRYGDWFVGASLTLVGFLAGVALVRGWLGRLSGH